MEANLNNLLEIFEKMNANGFSTTQPHKWGFYFLDNEKEGLLKVYEELKDHGYKMEKIESTDDDLYQLFVTKEEILEPEKLHRRNLAFNDLAAGCNILSYDGWDVEKIKKL